MPQRFEMSHAFHRLCDCLFVYNITLTKDHNNSKPLFDKLRQNLDLYLSHHLRVNFLQLFIPENMKLRIFLLKLL